ncbi:MAG TPA: DUF2231 domain-containing protein [Actinomycetota bacterium]|nr:DUF2231 domain-containing protein [Actinomycetota bacterium]
MPRYFSIRPTWTLKGRRFFGVRGWSGKPTHPPLTDFPVVCYALAALFDLVSFFGGRNDAAVAHDFFIAATLVLIVGFVVSIGTALTGFWDWWKGMPRRKGGVLGTAQHTQVWRTANFHMAVMLTVTAIVIVDIAVRLGQLHDGRSSGPVTVLSVIAAGLVLFGAGYGGTLVFDYQFNVESIGKTSTVWDETEVDQFPGRKKPAAPETTEATGSPEAPDATSA